MYDRHQHPRRAARVHAVLAALTLAAGAAAPLATQAQQHPVTPGQRATAQQVAARGVPLAELAPNAPESYVVQRGDTLWAISALYLRQPWRWPELWGMNLDSIANPHLIFPGQTLYLETVDGHARLRTSRPGSTAPETVRVSPRTRSESLSGAALPTLKPHLIEHFLAEPLVVDELTLEQAPRVIATRDERVVMAGGDRVYVRGPQGSPLELEPGVPRHYRVFRSAAPLKDPFTQEVLGYEAQYVGQATLVRGESSEQVPDKQGRMVEEYVPATVDLSRTREEVRVGDRLLPAPERSFSNYVPRAPEQEVDAAVVSIYGSLAVRYAGQNNVVALNRGSDDGMQPGHVLRLLTRGQRIVDKTDGERTAVRLPSEENGLVMVFRTFERVSYALILQAAQPVRVGDRLVNPE
ncbi:LysM peptidoglycan-binding domain-containing protein [Melaminivora alkalimesophila]|uniref:LysM domain-containing protein n=1 Tax=Melaminivora alkalimesophila TaxID=1165852 RepID=A0A317RC86_9BURK|nr:LysM domain-containing protein [Melaminivora alkalimesophila]PWW46849.1 LysM domain-containing protein [Melaminivora alkalimesophila]